MKLSTLIELSRCFKLLQDYENHAGGIPSDDYLACVKVKSLLDWAIAEALKGQQVEIEGYAL